MRLLQRDDLPTLLELLAAEDPEVARASSSLPRVLFDDPDFDPTLNLSTWDAEQPKLQGIACGVQRGEKGYLKLLCVHPRCRQGGLGSTLLASLERRLVARGVRQVEIDGAAPVYFRPGLCAVAHETEAFFARRGYQRVAERISLRLALPSPLDAESLRARATDEGFELRRARLEEAAWLTETIARHFSPSWAVETQLALNDITPAVHLALHGSDLAAFACSGLCGPCVFGPTGTITRHRGRGLGAALLARSLDDIAARGCESALISWIGPEGYYRQMLGPLKRLRYHVLRKTLP